ncbi:MAG TPA: cation diffusion facilitator family transporter [Ktedonobacterales bacterium]|jgi:cobalt-zinc-cadmium efflux system protein|nr:cation diffusion facilitator family transporter [Ktedonobacterales bacterium]
MATQARRAAKSQQSAHSHVHGPGGGHGGHAHTHALTREALRLGFLLTAAILFIEVIGGLLSHSLALLSDAGHVLTDVIALGLAWFAAAQAERPANERRTFGYHRVGILVALFNGLTLVVIALVIAFEAWRRLQAPEPVQPGIMIGAALLAVAVNVVIARRLHGGAENLNARAALLHAVGDIGASLTVVVGAVVIALTGATWVDPIISVAIAALIAFGSLRLIVETVNILMEATPADISTEAVARDICKTPGVLAVHDLHVWTIASGMRALSCHCMIDDIPPSASAAILDHVSDMLRLRYRIGHATIQFESDAHGSHEGFCACEPGAAEGLYCALSPESCGCNDHHAPANHADQTSHRRASLS